MLRKSLVVLLALAGCKGETKTVDNPDTLRDLDVCKKTLDEKNKLITALQEEAARNKPGGGEIVVAIEGNALTVKANATGGGGGVPAVDNKAAAAAAQQFLDVVARSRGAIQKCYEQALKKNQGLQGRTITLNVSGTLVSIPYVDVTIKMMESFGAKATAANDYSRIDVSNGKRYRGLDYAIEPDASAASYFFAIAAITGDTVKGTSMSATRTCLPGKVNFAIDQAAATPKMTFRGTAIAAVRIVRRIAASVSGSLTAAR